MRLSIILPLLAAACLQSVAQSYYVDRENPDMLRRNDIPPIETRTEFVLPDSVNGFVPLKTDLHIHTMYSDGSCTPQYRVMEAWMDGLDAIAIADHVEWHPYDGVMAKYLGVEKHVDGSNVRDLNVSSDLAIEAAKAYGITVIRATEVTRPPQEVGHFNALFTLDNNYIYDPDPLVSLRNAKKQNALVMHNHPGWRRNTTEHNDFELQAYGEGLIDGVEIMNGSQFYPKITDRVREKNLFCASSTDIHGTTAIEHRARGTQRNMTIVFATENTPEAIREALESRRTLAFWWYAIAGDEQLLKDLFEASVKSKRIGDQIVLTNTTSLRFMIERPGKVQLVLPPMSSIKLNVKEGKTLKFEVANMWCGAERHPEITIKK